MENMENQTEQPVAAAVEKKTIKQHSIVELKRVVPFLILGLLALLPMWDASQVVLYFVGVAGLIAIATHILRKAYFPYIDLEIFVRKALEHPIGAAIVAASVIYLLAEINTSLSHMLTVVGTK